jgi:predicted TIM-barrel fold metal-dependent hydrolase
MVCVVNHDGWGRVMRTRREVLRGLGAVGATAITIRANGAFASSAASNTAAAVQSLRDACDCHVHIFDPAKFPYVAKRVYTPPPASIESMLDLHKTLRLDRVVIVQPSVYGADNACTLDAIRKLGARARGVAVIDKDTSPNAIDEMAATGVRGIRLNFNTTPTGAIDADGSKRTLDMAAEKISGRGWHIQFYTRPHIIAALKSQIEQLPFPVVFDHFGGAKAASGPSQPGFDALLDLVKSGRAYVKVSAPYRISEKAPDFADVAPLAQALIAANPDRLVWGSDWPHPDSAFGVGKSLSEIAPPFVVDEGLVLGQVPKWTVDPAIREKILVANAARLYDFPDSNGVVTGSVPAADIPTAPR